jgi:hypothetical protein
MPPRLSRAPWFLAAAIVLLLANVMRSLDEDYCFTRSDLPAEFLQEGAKSQWMWKWWPPGKICAYSLPEGRTLVLGPRHDTKWLALMAGLALLAGVMSRMSFVPKQAIRFHKRKGGT